jgi:KDO2-lipid IV(A) lauroyltransferase
MSLWKNFRHRLERRGLEFLAAIVPRLPRRACLLLGRGLGDIAWALDRQGRTVAQENLECALGDRSTPAERRKIVRASYRNFVRTMLDLFWAQNLTPANYRDYLRLEGFEALRERHARNPGGSIFLCVHQGNFEWASLACGFEGFGNSVVAESFKNPLLGAVFNRLREVSGQKIVPQENSMLRLLKIVRRGGATGMLLDLSLHPLQAATVIEGFGLKMCVTLLHAVLAHRAGTLLIPVETEPLPDGTCRVIAHPPVEWPDGATPHQIAQRCWDFFEPILLANPAGWLWAYKHFRYRPRHATRPYPAYANDSAEFEELLRVIESASSAPV